MAQQCILVTGGAGYIGSHTLLQLLLGGYKAVVVDNLDNSSPLSIKRVQVLAGEFGTNLSFHKIDLRNKPELENLFASTKFDAVIHFAGLKAVGESVQKPLLYYDNNISGTVTLLEVMAAHGCKRISDCKGLVASRLLLLSAAKMNSCSGQQSWPSPCSSS